MMTRLLLFLIVILIFIEKNFSKNAISSSNLKSSENKAFTISSRILTARNQKGEGRGNHQALGQSEINQDTSTTAGSTTNQNSNIQGDQNVVGQAENTTSAIVAAPVAVTTSPLSPIETFSNDGSGSGSASSGFSGSAATSNTGVNQASTIQGNNNVVGQSADTTTNAISAPIGATGAFGGAGAFGGTGKFGGAGSFGVAGAASGANSNTAVNQNSAIQGSGNVVGQSANTNTGSFSMPISIAGYQYPFGYAGTTAAGAGANSIAGSNTALNQNANIQGNYNTVGQSANTGSSAVSTPISANYPNSGYGSALGQSGANSATNVGQTANIQGSGNVVGQAANTQANTASLPISFPWSSFGSGFFGAGAPLNTFGSRGGFLGSSYSQGTAGASSGSNAGAANVYGTPYYPGNLGYGGGGGGGGTATIPSSIVNPNTNVGQQAQITGSGNVVGQTANTTANAASIPIGGYSNAAAAAGAGYGGYNSGGGGYGGGYAGAGGFGYSSVNPNTNLNQNSQIQGNSNVVGQSANTQVNAASIPITYGSNYGLNGGFNSATGSNIGVNQASNIVGSGNTVGQQANTQSALLSAPISSGP